MRYKLFKFLKGIMKLILALLLWIAVGIFNVAISVVFSIPMHIILKIERE